MIQNSKIFIFMLILLSLLFAACTPAPVEPTSTTISHIVISEVMMGVKGNNNHDFIELYNPSEKIVDLKGFSLWYQLNLDKEPTLVVRWNDSYLIPPHGHYLIVREGEDFDLTPDALMTISLVSDKGSLLLTQGQDTIIDQLAWGSTEEILSETAPAPKPEQGQSIERLPLEVNGNFVDTDNNQADFAAQKNPNPQNVGSPITPLTSSSFSIEVIAPSSVEPGQVFEYQFVITNTSEATIDEATLYYTLPELLHNDDMTNEQAIDALDSPLEPHQSTTVTIINNTPWTYATLYLENIYLTSESIEYPVFAESVVTKIEGGSVPIVVARDLIGSELAVQGVVTMYPDGLYAGSGAKFYIEDETGGIQVYVSGAQGDLTMFIGMTVKVQGVITPYNGAIEIVPLSTGMIEVIAPVDKENPPQPKILEIFETTQNRSEYAGQLIQVQGRIARAEEFSYSYEVDVMDEFGNILTAYIDKNTGIDIEFLESGKYYRLTGILELNGTNVYLYPRLYADFEEIFPEALMIEANPPETIQSGGIAEMSFTVFNHTHETVDDITVRLPINNTFTVSDPQEGKLNGDFLEWTIPSMEGNGTSLELTFTIADTPTEDFVDVRGYEVEAPGLLRGTNIPVYIFKQAETPIWAIQGELNRSPYTTVEVTTKGVVTGVFPDLSGFYIQNLTPDDNSLTSEGIFVAFEEQQRHLDLLIGDLVVVEGFVSEGYQQTHIKIEDNSSVQVLDTDQDLPMPVALDPPLDDEASLAYYESLEGMLVMINEPAYAVSSVNKYGETFVVLDKHNIQRIMHGEQSGVLICIDDASSMSYDFVDEIEYPITQGSIVNQVVGPLAFNYGVFKVEPILPMQVDYATVELQTIEAAGDDEIRIMTWNVENLFDVKDPTVSSPPTPTFGEYKTSVKKVAQTIGDAGYPDIVAIQEVENIAILEDIAETTILEAYNYQPLLLEGFDSRLIDVGYLVREQNLTVLDLTQKTPPNGLMSRPTLALTVDVNDQQITLLNNHFLSMGGGEEATEPRRDAQAKWNVEVMEEYSLLYPEMDFVVLGDLNSYYDAKPIDTLREADLVHVMQDLAPEERYTYIYLGQSQVLDHILVSEPLWEQVTSIDILHTNADFPLPFEDDLSSQRKSDHDPVTVTLMVK